MKLTLLLILFIPCFIFGQDSASVYKDLQTIIASEKRSATARGNSEMRSLASNNFDVYHYRCEWRIHPSVWYIKGVVTPSFVMTSAGNSITLDLQAALTVDSVLYHNNKIAFQRDGSNVLTIQFPASINAGIKDSVSIFYQGVPVFEGFGAFYQYSHAGVPVIWTLSEPYGAKFWWPCKDGLSDKADSVDILITHPAIYTASANGMVVSRQVTDTMATTHFHHGYPIASYLVALAVTNYVVDDDTVMVGNKPYRFISYAYPEAASYFFGQEMYAKDAFRIFSELFGEYPFAKEKYGHTQFGWGGGMEHQTNSFMFNTSPNLSAHELGHQWFGDKVTCGSWRDIWLNEGFAQYSVILYNQYYQPGFYRSNLLSTLNSATSQPGGSVYVPDTTDFHRIFDGRLSYNKGAYVVHMLRWVLGDSALFRGLRQYLNDPALSYGFARTPDLQKHLEQSSGKSLGTFLQKWIYGEGYPNYQASWSQNNNLWAKVKLNQTTSHPSVSFYEMPVMLEFRSATQTKRVTVDHRYSGQEFTVEVGFAADTVVIDPDLWILSRIKTSVKTASSTAPDVISLYPNPSPRNAVLSLQNPTGSRLYVNLFNAAGQLLFKKEIITPGSDEVIHIPLERYPKGMYVLRVRNDKGMDVIKRIVH